MQPTIIAPQPQRPSAKALGKRAERNLRIKTFGLTPKRRAPTAAERDQLYFDSMMAEQRRMLCTEADNRVHIDRFPSPYRRLLVPSPAPHARPDVPYVHFAIEEVGQHDEQRPELPPIWQRLWAALRRLLGYTPAPEDEDAQPLIR